MKSTPRAPDERPRVLERFWRRSLRCSFCGKTHREVDKLLAGPRVFICGDCVAVCNEILAEDRLYEGGTGTPSDEDAG